MPNTYFHVSLFYNINTMWHNNWKLKLKNLLLISIVLLTTFMASPSQAAQKKYAILVGINDYYDTPEKLSSSSLHGCINDANSIKNLLIDKFGFDAKNIDTIYNKNATKVNILNSLSKILKECRAGDAVVFYYSGHGVWMDNPMSSKDTDVHDIGIDQAIVASDIYNSTNQDMFGCLIRDETLKKYFNLFIDKKAILTSLFDCCYSGQMVMATRYPTNGIKTPSVIGTRRGISSFLIVQDIMDYTGRNPLSFDASNTKKVESIGSKLGAKSNMIDTLHTDGIGDRALNISDAITIDEKDTVPRPADRKNSKFLNLNACTGIEPSQEFPDKEGIVHGAFTNALLHAYKNNRSEITVATLFNAIYNEVGTQKNSDGTMVQTPIILADKTRLGLNLIGFGRKK